MTSMIVATVAMRAWYFFGSNFSVSNFGSRVMMNFTVWSPAL